MSIDLSQLMLPSISPEGLKVLDLIASPEPDIKRLGKTILSDPTLASTLIKYANSPLYRRANQVSNVPTAIRILGLKSIRSAVAMATMRAMTEPETAVSRAILNHSLDIALLSKLIARKTHPELADDLEFLGLIHDMGMLILNQSFPEEYQTLFTRSIHDNISITTLEEAQFELTHDIIMAAISERFRLPEPYVDTLANFHIHKPSTSLEQRTGHYSCILDLAHHLWPTVIGEDECFSEVIIDSQERLGILLDLNENQLLEIVEEARVKRQPID